MQPIKNYVERMRPKTQCPERKPMTKILWSWLGAFMGIYIIAKLGAACTAFDLTDNLFLIGSFGASAVLTYGAPLAEFSQPRNLILGHVISALAGVTVYKFMPNLDGIALLAATSVSLSILAMHLFRCLHPPGGATALIAVIGSDKIHSLGYSYILYPVLAGSIILLIVALLVNNLSRNPNRHYPTYWY